MFGIRTLAAALAVSLGTPVLASAQGLITTVAGSAWVFRGDGGPAVNAPLGFVAGVAVDAAGNVFAADSDNSLVVKISPNGILTVIAGNGTTGFSGDGGPATSASLDLPRGVAVDSAGNVYIADANNDRIRKVTPAGTISTVAGNGQTGFSGDGGPATAARLNFPLGVAVDGAGNLYIADTVNNRVRRVTAQGIISTVVGTGTLGFSGDGGPAASAQLAAPFGLAVDAAGNLYIADTENKRIRKVAAGGTISTVAGNGQLGFSGDAGPATSATLSFPFAVAVDAAGNLTIADTINNRVRQVNPSGTISTVAGNGQAGFSGDGGPAASAQLADPFGVAVDAAGNLYIGDSLNERVRAVGPGGTIATVAGNGLFKFGGDGGPATRALLNFPSRVALDPSGNLYVADTGNHRIRKVAPGGTISTLAGNGLLGFSGDGGPASSAQLNSPEGVALDAGGNLYIADTGNNRVRKIAPGGTITTVAGSGTAGLASPGGLAVDAAGALYIADTGNHRILKITADGSGSTVAGTGQMGFSGDGGPASSALLANPAAIALDAAGNLYIADTGNHRIRKVSAGGTISTVAGNGQEGFAGDGGLAINAQLDSPGDVEPDAAGNLYISDSFNDRVRQVLVGPPPFSVSPANLAFSAAAGSGVTPQQQIAVTSPVAGLAFSTQASTEDGGKWLVVPLASGIMPGTISISVNVASLAAGTYRGTVIVQAPLASPSAQTVAVVLTVQPAAPAQLSVTPAALSFQAQRGAGSPPAQVLAISNSGSGTLNWTAQTRTDGNWLSLSATSGSATASSPAAVQVVANVAALPARAYSGSVRVSSPATNQTITIAATLLLSEASATIRLGQTGLLFTGVEGGGPVAPQSIGIANIGQGTMSWTVSASTLSGGAWLAVSPGGGTSVAGSSQPPQVTVQVDLSGLVAGSYSGLVEADAAGTSNTPQFVTVILNVLPAGTNPGAVAQPAGLIFTAPAGTAAAASQAIGLTTSGGASVQATVGIETVSGGNWLSATPLNVQFSATAPKTITVTALPGTLAAGVYRGALTVVFDDDSPTQVVDVVLVVTGATAAHPAASPPAAACTPQKLLAVYRSPAGKFTALLAWPSSMEVQLVDDCGNAVSNATVVASFSNHDPPLTLNSLGNGIYTGTWRPLTPASPVTVKVRADSPPLAAADVEAVIPQVQDNPKAALVFPGGVVNAASFVPGQPLAAGSIVAVFGRNLAASTAAAETVPLPISLSGSSLSAANLNIPLFFASAGQINIQLPFELPTNSSKQLLGKVPQGGSGTPALTVPEPITVGTASPGLFSTNSSGSGQGEIVIAATGEAAAPTGSLGDRPARPAKRGEFVSFFATGLGAVRNQPPSGRAALSDPLSTTMATPEITIGGVPATANFSGLAPFFVGLYQVNAQVPDGAPTGDAVPVVLTIGGASSNTVTMAVQ